MHLKIIIVKDQQNYSIFFIFCNICKVRNISNIELRRILTACVFASGVALWCPGKSLWLPSCFLLITWNLQTYYKLLGFFRSLQIWKTKKYSLSFRSFAYIYLYFYDNFFGDRFIIAFIRSEEALEKVEKIFVADFNSNNNACVVFDLPWPIDDIRINSIYLDVFQHFWFHNCRNATCADV